MIDPRIALIAAASQNRVIGLAKKMPWSLPADLKHFKAITWGHIIVMGRKTYESIGDPLPGRINIVFSAKPLSGNLIRVSGLEDFFHLLSEKDLSQEWKGKRIFIIGGETIFKLFLPYAAMIFLTRINENFAGDTYFPLIDENQWKLTSLKKGLRNSQNPHDYEFLTYEKVKQA